VNQARSCKFRENIQSPGEMFSGSTNIYTHHFCNGVAGPGGIRLASAILALGERGKSKMC